MARPWLSVAMPVHCGGADLPATLASVVAERPEGVEFLIYDSTPDESCRAIVANHAGALAIRYHAVPEMRPWAEKTNRAIAEAAAPHVAMLHQDDLWRPGHLKALRRSLAEHPQAVMHVAPASLIDTQGQAIGQWNPPLAPGLWSGSDFGRRLLVQNFVAIPTPLVRRDAWLSTGGMSPELWYTADWDLYLKLAAHGSIAVARDVTTAFRIHAASQTMSGSRDAQAFARQLEIILERHGPNFGLEGDARLRARARASVSVNCGLAAAAAGHRRALLPALWALLRLGPVDLRLYLRDSRLIERLLPRLRLRLAGML